MKNMSQFGRIIFVVLSFAMLLLSGCGGGSDSTPTGTFSSNQVSGKTFEYASAGSTGTLAFNADGTWSTTLGTATFSGTWSISNGKLVCVTTSGGNHTITYTLLSTTTNSINASYVEVNPAAPNSPVNGTATFTATFTAGQISGKTFAYASAGSTGTLAFNADATWSTTIGTSTFSGTWSISNGKLVCVTTTGGNHTITYTQLITDSANSMNASYVEVNPAAPNSPVNGTATFTATFTAGQMSGKTFAYASADSTGTLAFNADATWSTTIGTSTFSGTWSISNGKLVCVTTIGGNHTITYTQLITDSANTLNASFVEVNPAAPNNPVNGTATFTATFTAGQMSGKTFAYASADSTGTLTFNADATWSTTIGTSTFSGTWSISNGKLVCVTTTGGNHTLTYTMLTTATNALAAAVVEVNPADPNNPSNYTATLTPTST